MDYSVHDFEMHNLLVLLCINIQLYIYYSTKATKQENLKLF